LLGSSGALAVFWRLGLRASPSRSTAPRIFSGVGWAYRIVIWTYITRWRIEDVIRSVKQSYRLEDMRCLTYHRLRALMALVTAAAFFAAVYLGLRMKLRVLASHVLRASKRVFGIPDSDSMPWPTASGSSSTVRPRD
jgi:hypothetical protein